MPRKQRQRARTASTRKANITPPKTLKTKVGILDDRSPLRILTAPDTQLSTCNPRMAPITHACKGNTTLGRSLATESAQMGINYLANATNHYHCRQRVPPFNSEPKSYESCTSERANLSPSPKTAASQRRNESSDVQAGGIRFSNELVAATTTCACPYARMFMLYVIAHTRAYTHTTISITEDRCKMIPKWPHDGRRSPQEAEDATQGQDIQR